MSNKSRHVDYKQMATADAEDFSNSFQKIKKDRPKDGRQKDRGNPHREAARRKQASRYAD